jgi:hypothetical protein
MKIGFFLVFMIVDLGFAEKIQLKDGYCMKMD